MKHSSYPSLSALALLLGTFSLVGCGGANIASGPGSSTSSTSPTPPAAAQVVPGPSVSGTVLGGHSPIQGAHVYLLQPGTAGYGSLAASLLGSGSSTSPGGYTLSTDVNDPNVPLNDGINSAGVGGQPTQYVTTDANGAFNLTDGYVCTVGRPVYIYAYGGNIGGGSLNNNNIVQLATLGLCPSSGNFSTAGNGAISYIYLNEVSTVATAYTFQPYTLSSQNDAFHIGSTNTTEGLLGISNAALTAAQLYNIEGSTTLLSTSGDGEGHLANNLTASANGIVPQANIDSLANILSACVDSSPTAVGTATALCTSLFTIATDNGEIGGTAPLDTGTAAINIARFPAGNSSAGTTHVDATYAKDLYNLQPGPSPYVPDLSNAPNDWTIAINYPVSSTAYGAVSNPDFGSAESIAIDDLGQVWITGQTKYSIVRLSPLGELSSTAQFFPGYIPGYVSVDGSDNAWTGNANCQSLNPLCPTGTAIFQAGSNGVFSTSYGSGYESAYNLITNQAGDAFFFAQNTASAPNYDMFEYGPGGATVAGSPFNISGSYTTSTTTTGNPYTAPINIIGATETKSGATYTYTFNFTAGTGSTATTPLAVGDVVSFPTALTDDQGTGTTPVKATGWQNLTSVTVASVNSTTNPTSFTATATPTVATTDTVSTNTNGTTVTATITGATVTGPTHPGGVTTYTYTFTYSTPTGSPALAAGDILSFPTRLTDASGGTDGTTATGWQNLASVTVGTVISGTQFSATGATPTSDSVSRFGVQGNGATGSGVYDINGASGTATYPSTTNITTTTTITGTGAIPSGENVAHGAIAEGGHLWITTEASPYTIARIGPTGVPDFTSITTVQQPEFPAIDASGNAWIPIQETASQIYKVTPTGTTTVLSGGAGNTGALLTSTFGAAVDGNGNIWFANRCGNYGACGTTAGENTIFVLNGGTGSTAGTANTAISPTTNYYPEAQYPATAATFTPILYGSLNLAIDPSGNVWITNYTGNEVVELIGAAAPVVTPLSVAAGTNSLGTKP